MVTPLAKLIGAAIAAGKPVEQIKGILAESLHQTLPRPERPTVLTPLPNTPTGPTVAEYYASWIKEQIPVVRRAQARDYRRHLIRYVLPILGKVPLAELRASHVRGLQAELLEQEVRRRDGSVKKRSVKHVKNIIAGSFRAMIQQARIDELVTRDVFAGIKWPKWEPPKADPFTMDEVKRILASFRTKRFGMHPGAGSMSVRHLPHPPFIRSCICCCGQDFGPPRPRGCNGVTSTCPADVCTSTDHGTATRMPSPRRRAPGGRSICSTQRLSCSGVFSRCT